MGNRLSQGFSELINRRRKSDTETGHDPAVHGARLEERAYNNYAFKKPGVDVSDPQQQNAALKIQTQYRQHAAQQQVDGIRKDDAAVKIQAGFRGYLDRQDVKSRKDSGEDKAEEGDEVDIDLTDPAVEEAALKIQAQFKGFKARKQVQSQQVETGQPEEAEKEAVGVDLADPEVTKAALKIQSGFRGHLARREIRQKKDDGQSQTISIQLPPRSESAQEEEEVDIDLSDPDVEKAALKIQAGFKGFKTRKVLRREQESEQAEVEAAGVRTEQPKDEGKEEEIDIDLTDPATQKAALRIQAGFRGYKTRKEFSGQGHEEEDSVKPSSPLPAAAEYEPKNKRREESEPDHDQADKQEEEVDIDLNDPEVEKAALKIQAGFKGFKARKEMPNKVAADASAAAEASEAGEPIRDVQPAGGSQEVDVDHTDLRAEQAAIKIQAGYRKYRSRQVLKHKMTVKDKDIQNGADQDQNEDEQLKSETNRSAEDGNEMEDEKNIIRKGE